MKFQLRGKGPAVLLLHGIPTCGRLWDPVVEILRHHFTCVIVDLPGMGESAALADRSPDPSQYANEIECLRRELSIPVWHVVGHDAGSAIAVHYSAGFPDCVKKLVLCSPPIFPELRPPLVFRLLRAPLVGDILAPLVMPMIWRIGLPASVERRDEQTNEILAAFRRPFVGAGGTSRFVQLLRWGDPVQVLSRTAGLLPTIGAPTLVIHGRHDHTIPVSFATRAAALIPNANVLLLDSGHFLPLNCPVILSHHLVRFFEGA
jgi:pimeloyl-ACP methyl ester carboxylesterase